MDGIKEKIEIVLETFGMKNKKAAEIMCMGESNFKKKITGVKYYEFNEEDYNALVEYISQKAKGLANEAV